MRAPVRGLLGESERWNGWTLAEAAGIGDEVAFATKPALAQKMIERAVAAGVPFGRVRADEVYGCDSGFRLWLETAGIAHLVAVPKSAMAARLGVRRTAPILLPWHCGSRLARPTRHGSTPCGPVQASGSRR
jgi:SRSO17 transposase